MSGAALSARFAGIICDLDGVVYAGRGAIEHAVDALNELGTPVVYATNNASRTPAEVGDHLRDLGVRVDDDFVLTSSVAAARYLRDSLEPGSPVLAVGGAGVSQALRAAGLRPLAAGDRERPAAVLQGFGFQVTAEDLGAAAHAVREGATWVVTNDDLTLPTPRGPAPGNGALVAAVHAAVDAEPVVIGKPNPPLYDLAARILAVPADRVLAVGDRLETDIQGATATGMHSALVLTGVHGPADAAAAKKDLRPTFVLDDLRGLGQGYPDAARDGQWHVRGSARARLGDVLEVQGQGIDAIRASLDALWAAVDGEQISPQDAGRLVANG